MGIAMNHHSDSRMHVTPHLHSTAMPIHTPPAQLPHSYYPQNGPVMPGMPLPSTSALRPGTEFESESENRNEIRVDSSSLAVASTVVTSSNVHQPSLRLCSQQQQHNRLHSDPANSNPQASILNLQATLNKHLSQQRQGECVSAPSSTAIPSAASGGTAAPTGTSQSKPNSNGKGRKNSSKDQSSLRSRSIQHLDHAQRRCESREANVGGGAPRSRAKPVSILVFEQQLSNPLSNSPTVLSNEENEAAVEEKTNSTVPDQPKRARKEEE